LCHLQGDAGPDDEALPCSALALWALGANLLLGSWIRRICLRVGAWPVGPSRQALRAAPGMDGRMAQSGRRPRPHAAEAQYLGFFTLTAMAFGFVVFGSMMIAAGPVMATAPSWWRRHRRHRCLVQRHPLRRTASASARGRAAAASQPDLPDGRLTASRPDPRGHPTQRDPKPLYRSPHTCGCRAP
jgi:hypothetical protein